jgi:hypothetical protein
MKICEYLTSFFRLYMPDAFHVQVLSFIARPTAEEVSPVICCRVYARRKYTPGISWMEQTDRITQGFI